MIDIFLLVFIATFILFWAFALPMWAAVAIFRWIQRKKNFSSPS